MKAKGTIWPYTVVENNEKDICQMLEYIGGEECTSRGGEEQAQDLFHCYSAQLREFRVDRHTRHPSVVNDISLSLSSLRYKYK